jgi:hypothetical protein
MTEPNEIVSAAEWQQFHAAIALQLQPVLRNLYEELAKRGEADQLSAYAENYVRSMRDSCIVMMNKAGIFSELRDGNSVLDCWDQLCIDRGWTEVDGVRYFPPAELQLRALPTTELATVDLEEAAEPAPVITAEAIAQIAVLTADRIIEGLKPPQGDLVIEYDPKNPARVLGVRRKAPQTD